jgi:hypothetical protein
MDDLLIAIFLFSSGVAAIFIMGKHPKDRSTKVLFKIRMYALGAFFICGSIFVFVRFLYNYFHL